MHTDSLSDNLHKMSYFLRKIRKNIINLSSAELAHGSCTVSNNGITYMKKLTSR